MSVVIHILEAAFLVGILGSAVVIVWVFIEDLRAIQANKEESAEIGKASSLGS